jgi:hypothetical protein
MTGYAQMVTQFYTIPHFIALSTTVCLAYTTAAGPIRTVYTLDPTVNHTLPRKTTLTEPVLYRKSSVILQ